MSLFEKIITYRLFDNGKSIGNWDLEELAKKAQYSAKPFTYAEKHALMFLEQIGMYMN